MKGHTIIELRDVITGEVQRIEDDNMFTAALDNIFNRAPYYFVNPVLGNLPNNPNYQNPMTPVAEKAIGGLLLFPDPLTEDVNLVYAPADNKPTGIASFDAYGGDDARRGSLDSIMTGPIENGYVFTWTFSTSRANGQISAAALTSARGGQAFWDGGANLYQDSHEGSSPDGIGRLRLGTLTNASPLAAEEDGIYLFLADGRIVRVDIPAHKITLTGRFDADVPIKEIGKVDTMGTIAKVGSSIWSIQTAGNSSGNATVKIDKYDMATWEKTTQTLTVSAPLKASAGGSTIYSTAKVGDYLFLPAYNGVDLYKVNINNPADVILIAGAFPNADYRNGTHNLVPFNGGVICAGSYIEADGTIHRTGFSALCGIVDNWAITLAYEFGGVPLISATVLTPYLATINNVTPFTKTAQQEMTVTYTVTEE